MELYSQQLYSQLSRFHEVSKISLGRSQLNLLWFIPWSLTAGVVVCRIRRISHLHIGDALLAPVGLLIAALTGVRLSITTYGLDVVYPKRWYQWMIRKCLPRYPTVVCISRSTRAACIARGVSPAACVVVPCGVTGAVVASSSKSEAKSLLMRNLSVELVDTLVIGTVGRLVPRKGVAWFIEHVLPLLPADTTYLVAGQGDELERIRDLALAAPRPVVLLGHTSDEIKRLVYRSCDVFVMPNRKVAGDMEGFGLVALEAGANGTPVVASCLDGIRDAVLDGETGLLVDPQDPTAFAEAIVNASEWEGEEIGRIVLGVFSWERVHEAYKEALRL